MPAPVTLRGRDLRVLAAIVSEDRPDLPDGGGLPPSLLADLGELIPSDYVTFWGSEHKPHHPAWFIQQTAPDGADEEVYWQHYQACQPTCYPNAAATCAKSSSTPPGNGTTPASTATITR